jgi:hypothetical protein
MTGNQGKKDRGGRIMDGKLIDGRLTKEDEQYIVEHPEMSCEQIAAIRRRRPQSIANSRKRYLARKPINEVNDIALKFDLKHRHFWPALKKEFTVEELDYFEQDWTRTVMQFQGNVTHTEELQIRNYCTLSILMSRSLQSRKKMMEHLEHLQTIYDAEIAKNDTTRNNSLVEQVDRQMVGYRAGVSSITQEYDRLFKDQQTIMRDMKTTRDQRIDKLESKKQVFIEWVKYMQDATNRVRESKIAELGRAAMEKTKNELMTEYKYLDGTVDYPILSVDTITKLTKDQEKEDVITDNE